jgi:hypothetical protein
VDFHGIAALNLQVLYSDAVRQHLFQIPVPSGNSLPDARQRLLTQFARSKNVD